MIYVQGGDKCESVKDLIEYCFSEVSGKCRPSYSDEACTILECRPARRSFWAIVEIVRTYFTNATKEEIAYIMLYDIGLCFFRCEDIGKIVFLRADNLFNIFNDMVSNCSDTKDITDMDGNDIVNFANKYKDGNLL